MDENLEDYHHPFAQDIRDQIGHDVWSDYFTFSFVRNPWDRMVSWYSMAMQNVSLHTPSLERIRQAGGFDKFLKLDGLAHSSNNQLDYLTDEDGNIIVDFIGRYEQLRMDFNTICERLDMQAILRHLNFSRHGDYQDYYNDETRELVAKRFAKDIEVFGYTFHPK